MVKVDLAGKPTGDFDTSSDNTKLTDRVRQRIRSSVSNKSKRISFNWDTVLPRLVITSDTDDFDMETLAHFQEEGFQLSYLAYKGDQKAYSNELDHLSDDLEAGDRYAIIAYGEAATLCLRRCLESVPKLVAIIAYYPTHMPNSNADFPPALWVQIHLAGTQKFGTRHPSFRYPGIQPGFAEHNMEEYNSVGANLSWSRTLGCLRQAFGLQIDHEEVMDHYMAVKWGEKDAETVMRDLFEEPHITHVPTMTGGVGTKDLRRFYAEFFIPNHPPDLKVRLLSRTIGIDRVADELLCTFRHTCEMPWVLPGIPPTDKRVEMVVVSIVCIRGGKVFHEHVHWDQASVLVQVGLLDPKYIPPSFTTAERGKEKDVRQLPVLGVESVRKVVDENDGPSNALIPGW